MICINQPLNANPLILIIFKAFVAIDLYKITVKLLHYNRFQIYVFVEIEISKITSLFRPIQTGGCVKCSNLKNDIEFKMLTSVCGCDVERKSGPSF